MHRKDMLHNIAARQCKLDITNPVVGERYLCCTKVFLEGLGLTIDSEEYLEAYFLAFEKYTQQHVGVDELLLLEVSHPTC
jgi:hypothetical protein